MCFILWDQEIKVTKNCMIVISCLQVFCLSCKFLTFSSQAVGIPGFDPRKAAKMALVTIKLWLESNQSPIDCVIFCTYENADYEICKDLISTVYFSVSKYH